MKELIVKTPNPAALDKTLQQLGAVVGQYSDGNYSTDENGHYAVRAVNGNIGFVEFSIKHQGYAEIIGSREIDHASQK